MMMMNLAILATVGYTRVGITDATTTLSTMRVGPRNLVHPTAHGMEFGRPVVDIRDMASA